MKKIGLIICMLILQIGVIACPVCEKQQPKILKGITHGAGPQSNWDYVFVLVTVLIVLATLIYTIKWLVKPGESSDNHIKRTVLN